MDLIKDRLDTKRLTSSLRRHDISSCNDYTQQQIAPATQVRSRKDIILKEHTRHNLTQILVSAHVADTQILVSAHGLGQKNYKLYSDINNENIRKEYQLVTNFQPNEML